MIRQFKKKKSIFMSKMTPNVVGVSRSETINRGYRCGSTPIKNKERRTVSYRGCKISILTDVNFRETVSAQALAVLVRLICRRETMNTPIPHAVLSYICSLRASAQVFHRNSSRIIEVFYRKACQKVVN